MANNNGKRMVKEDLLNYLEAVQTNYPDPSDIGGGGSSYTAGTGIKITDNTISVDSTVVALKSDLSVYAKLNDDTQNITANNITVTPGAGYIHTTYGPTTIAMSIPRTPGYTLTIPTKDGILATIGDIPTYVAGTGIDITNNTIAIDSTVVALKSDIPTVPTKTSELTNDSDFVITSDLATVAISGDYYDLSNIPSIPDPVSGTNDGTNWTSLTIGNTTYNIPSGGGGGGTTVSGTNDGTNWTSLTIGSDTYGIPSGGSGSGPTVTRYTGYKDYPASTSGSIYAQFCMNSSTLANFLNIEDVKEGDYVDITVKYSWDNKGEYENFRFYIPAKPTSSSSRIFPNTQTRMYDVDNNKMEQYT